MPKPTPLQEERLVNEFLVRTNRPQSVTNIVDALQAAPTPLKKAAVDRATASLVARGDVTLKEYGKAKVFITNQSTIDVPSPEERAAIDERLAQLEAAAVDGQAAVASANAAAADVYATLSDADALARSTEVKVQRSELEAKVASFGGGVVLSEEERAALEQKYAEVMVRLKWDAFREGSEGGVYGRGGVLWDCSEHVGDRAPNEGGRAVDGSRRW